jgi:hypothetical protein
MTQKISNITLTQPICHPTECRLTEGHGNKTFCINDNLPKKIELKGDNSSRGEEVYGLEF